MDARVKPAHDDSNRPTSPHPPVMPCGEKLRSRIFHSSYLSAGRNLNGWHWRSARVAVCTRTGPFAEALALTSSGSPTSAPLGLSVMRRTALSFCADARLAVGLQHFCRCSCIAETTELSTLAAVSAGASNSWPKLDAKGSMPGTTGRCVTGAPSHAGAAGCAQAEDSGGDAAAVRSGRDAAAVRSAG